MALNTEKDLLLKDINRLSVKIEDDLGFSMSKYTKENKREFLEFINQMQDDRNIQYIKNKISDENLKAPNHKMIYYLKNIDYNSEMSNFLDFFYKKSYNKDEDFLYENKSNKKEIESLKESFRDFIRDGVYMFPKIIPKEYLEDFSPELLYNKKNVSKDGKKSEEIYPWKISLIKAFIKENFDIIEAKEKNSVIIQEYLSRREALLSVGRDCDIDEINEFKDFIEELKESEENPIHSLFWIKNFIEFSMYVIGQLIVHDIIHEKIKKEKREENFIRLSEKIDFLHENMTKESKNSDSIFHDFFTFIFLNFDVMQNKRLIEIHQLIIRENEIYKHIENKQLSKEEIFKYYLENLNGENKDFFVKNFMDIDEIKKIEKENNDFFAYFNQIEKTFLYKDATENKTSKTELSKKIFEKSKPHNNFDDDIKLIEHFSENIGTLGNHNLQAYKVFAQDVFNSKIKTKKNLTLKKEIKDSFKKNDEYFCIESPNISFKAQNKDFFGTDSYYILREKITSGMYREKNILNEYERYSILFQKMNRILEEAIKLKDIYLIADEISKAMYSILDEISSINENESVTVVFNK